jgi:hypothetical protein
LKLIQKAAAKKSCFVESRMGEFRQSGKLLEHINIKLGATASRVMLLPQL